MSIAFDQAFGAQPPSYKTIQELDKKVRMDYVPPSLRVPGFGTHCSNGAKLVNDHDPPSIELTMQRYTGFAIKEISTCFAARSAG